MEEQIDRWMDGWVNDGCMDGRTGRWMNGWKNRYMDAWKGEWIGR